jgi:uridine kinase
MTIVTIGIAGGTGAGKVRSTYCSCNWCASSLLSLSHISLLSHTMNNSQTTLARRLYQALGGKDHVNYLVHDSYYRDLSQEPMHVRAATNFDHPSSLETDLLLQHIRALKQGQACEVPTYDFETHARTNKTHCLTPRNIVLVEGILLFCHPELVQELDIKVFVVSSSSIST